VERIEVLSQSLPAADAAEALIARAVVQFAFLGEVSGAEKSARRALQLSPTNDAARNILLLIATVEDRMGNFVQVCEERLAREPSASWAFRAAQASERLGNSNEVARFIKQGLDADSKDPHCLLGLASIQVREATTISSMVRAQMALNDAFEAIKARRERPDQSTTETTLMEWLISYWLLMAIHAALDDDLPTARTYVREVETKAGPEHVAAIRPLLQ
jgi:hypothetical protein